MAMCHILLFDTSGVITFILGMGQYCCLRPSYSRGGNGGRRSGTQNVSVDAGWGKRRPGADRDSAQITASKSIKDLTIIKKGCYLNLEGGMQVLVTNVTRGIR
jgi:hypothetical protein